MIEGLEPGGGIPYFPFEKPAANILQTFPAPLPKVAGFGRQWVTFTTKEVTALCPLTSQPDFYTVVITYIPKDLCIESKSAKLYFGAYRQQKGFIEELTLRILSDWVKACQPQKAQVVLTMVPRGGITISVDQVYEE